MRLLDHGVYKPRAHCPHREAPRRVGGRDDPRSVPARRVRLSPVPHGAAPALLAEVRPRRKEARQPTGLHRCPGQVERRPKRSPPHRSPCAAPEPLPESSLLQLAEACAPPRGRTLGVPLLQAMPRKALIPKAQGEGDGAEETGPQAPLALNGGGLSLGARYGAVAGASVLVEARAAWRCPVEQANVAGVVECPLPERGIARGFPLPLFGRCRDRSARDSRVRPNAAERVSFARHAPHRRRRWRPLHLWHGDKAEHRRNHAYRHASPHLAVEHGRSVGAWAAALKSLGCWQTGAPVPEEHRRSCRSS